MENELLEMIASYLGDDYSEDQEAALNVIIKKVISRFKVYVNYPKSFTDEKIQEDLKKNEFCLFDLILYSFNMQGIEFQNSHSEIGTSRTWNNEYDIYSYYGVVPYVDL